MKTEVGAAAPLAAPGQQPGQPLPNVGQTPPASAATSGGALVPNGAAGGGAVVPAGGGPPVAGAPGAAGSSSQGRKSTLPVQALVHAFHCTDPACQQKTCADTKQVLKRMEVHVQQCPTRRAQRQSAQQGGPPPQQAECKVCKLWQALHRTKSSSGQQQSVQQRGGMQPSAAGRGGPGQAGYRPSGGPTAQNQEAVRARLRQIDPAQVKRMLLSHVRACQNKQCQTCHKLRERIKSRAASSSHRAQGQHQMTLPKGWEVCIARSSGDLYYYQPKTNKSQWDYPKPDGLASNEASSSHRAQGQQQQQPPSTGQPHDLGGDVLAPMISLSVPVLLTTVKTLMPPETHEQLDQMLQRYMQKEIGKQQVCSSSSPISTPPYLTLAACRSPHPLPPPSLTAPPPSPLDSCSSSSV